MLLPNNRLIMLQLPRSDVRCVYFKIQGASFPKYPSPTLIEFIVDCALLVRDRSHNRCGYHFLANVLSPQMSDWLQKVRPHDKVAHLFLIFSQDGFYVGRVDGLHYQHRCVSLR